MKFQYYSVWFLGEYKWPKKHLLQPTLGDAVWSDRNHENWTLESWYCKSVLSGLLLTLFILAWQDTSKLTDCIMRWPERTLLLFPTIFPDRCGNVSYPSIPLSWWWEAFGTVVKVFGMTLPSLKRSLTDTALECFTTRWLPVGLGHDNTVWKLKNVKI